MLDAPAPIGCAILQGEESAIVDLYQEFAALIRALEAGRVDYAVAGGLAVAIWGVPRATQDIDLLVPPPQRGPCSHWICCS